MPGEAWGGRVQRTPGGRNSRSGISSSLGRSWESGENRENRIGATQASQFRELGKGQFPAETASARVMSSLHIETTGGKLATPLEITL